MASQDDVGPSRSRRGSSTSSASAQVGAAASSWPAKPTLRTRTSSTGKDKGKGKQRALDDEDESPGRRGMEFSIRFTDGTTLDLIDLFVNESETVREVKRRIRLLRPTTATSRLRLIYLGRILSDGTRLVPWTASMLERQAHQEKEAQRRIRGIDLSAIEDAVKSAVGGSTDDASEKAKLDAREDKGKGKAKGKQREGSEHDDRTGGRTIWLHCSVGEPGSLKEEEEAAAAAADKASDPSVPGATPTSARPLAGFDRLREAGFSEEDIQNMRTQFHEEQSPFNNILTADDDEHARALEEQWMESLGAGGADTGSLDPSRGMYTTLFKGVVAGFFLPFLPLFFFRNDAEQVFSKRMQMAIVAGLSINVLYGALRAFLV